jgi:hypothetical protein
MYVFDLWKRDRERHRMISLLFAGTKIESRRRRRRERRREKESLMILS